MEIIGDDKKQDEEEIKPSGRYKSKHVKFNETAPKQEV